MRADFLAAKMMHGKLVSFLAEIRRNVGGKCEL